MRCVDVPVCLGPTYACRACGTDEASLDPPVQITYNPRMHNLAVLHDVERVVLTHLHYFTAPVPFRSGAMTSPTLDCVLVMDGELVIDAPGGPMRVGPGEFSVRGPHCTGDVCTAGAVTLFHGYFTLDGGRIETIHAPQHAWAHTLSFAPDPAPYAHTLVLPDVLHLEYPDEIAALLRQIRHARACGLPGSELLAQADFLRVLYLITQAVMATVGQESSIDNTPILNPHIRCAVAFITLHLAQPVSPRDVAAHLDMNTDYLGRLFQRYLGESVGAYILHRRLTIARQLLATTTLSIKQVAMRVGFPDQLYFTRLFRRETGMTPTEYQQTHRDQLLTS